MNFQSTDRILIIGGSGFIGCHLVDRCLKDTPYVTCLGPHRSKMSKTLSSKVVKIYGNISRHSSIKKALGDTNFDYAFNLGGYIDHTAFSLGGRKVIQTHFEGLLNIVNNLNRKTLKRLVQIGSSDEYGNTPPPQNEKNTQGIPISPYALAKQMGTSFLMMLAKHEGFPATVVRPFLVYGPGQDASRFLPQIILSCLKGENVPVTLGEQKRDFCYVEDVVEGLVRAALTKDAEGNIFNIASGIPITIRSVMESVSELIVGGSPCYGARPYRSGESMELYADISKAIAILKWQPTIDLGTGLKRTIAYYRKHLKL